LTVGLFAVLLGCATVRQGLCAILFVAACAVGIPLATSGYCCPYVLFPLTTAVLSANPAYHFGKWCFALDGALPEPTTGSDKGYSETLGALAFVLTQVIAVAASQIGQQPLYAAPMKYTGKLVLLYVPLTVAILGSIVAMIRSTKHEADTTRTVRSFDRGSLRFMRWVLGLGLVFAVGLPLAAYYGYLPRQAAPGRVALNDWSDYATKNEAITDNLVAAQMQPREVIGAEVVKVNVPIAPHEFPEGVPQKLIVTVTTKDNVIDAGWRVNDGNLFIGDPSKKIKPKAQPAFSRNIQNPHVEPPVRVFDATLDELQSGESYTLVLTLWKKSGASQKDAKGMAEFLSSQREKALDVQSTWPRY
jgi:hypothetical protein